MVKKNRGHRVAIRCNNSVIRRAVALAMTGDQLTKGMPTMPLGLNRSYRKFTFLITCAAALSACHQPSGETATNGSNPGLACAFALAPSDDSNDCVAAIVSSLSLEQKIGQMIQGEIRDVTPDDVRDFYLGSVLNGGGGFPSNDKYSTVSDWVQLADDYYNASLDTSASNGHPNGHLQDHASTVCTGARRVARLSAA